jgi:formylglycine-generating enzyme required for sulfatase activity
MQTKADCYLLVLDGTGGGQAMTIARKALAAIVGVLAAMLSATAPASAEKRVALVVGNGAYTNIPKLDNPANDARLMADTLRSLGFSLVGGGPQLNLDETGFRRAVQAFGTALSGADVALFYFAGHGVQVRGNNYLVPVGANPVKEADVDFQMLDTNVVLRQMESAGARLNLVILDACRNNPFGGRGLRSSAAGLAQMQAPQGTLISFATQPGNVAIDGTGRNSPYTQALADAIRKPGVDIFRTFNEVGLAVAKATGGVQQPWVSLSPITGDFYFAGAAAVPKPAQDDDSQRKLAEAQARIAAFEREASARAAEEERRRIQTADAQRKAEQESAAAREREAAEARRKAEQERSKVTVVAPPVTPPAAPSQIKPAVGVFPPAPGATSLSPDRERALKPKDTFKECDICPEMVVIPAGSFTMGSPASEKNRLPWMEGPQRKVTIAQPFAAGKVEVTVDEYVAFVKDTGHDTGSACLVRDGLTVSELPGRSFSSPSFPQTGSHPATCVNWPDAKAYVAWLSKKTGRSYRLLSEAEWEYAARAGTATRHYFGDNDNGLCAHGNGADRTARRSNAISSGTTIAQCDDRHAYTAPVGSFPPNAFGLYDMYGNVQEWIDDCYSGYSAAPTDGSAQTGGDCDTRILRGGSWNGNPWELRSARRDINRPSLRSFDYGLRVARTLTTDSKVAVVAPPVAPPVTPSPVKPAVGVFPSAPGVTPLAPERERSLKPKDSFKECDNCPEMVVIPAGSFMMGSPANEKIRGANEGPQHRVSFARQFAVGRFEVTVDQFTAFVKETGYDAGSKCSTLEGGDYPTERSERSFVNPGYSQTGAHPAVCLNWHDAKAYVGWLSRKTGKLYRLLTESEWEHVARGGTTTPFWWGASISSVEANYNGKYAYAGGPESEFRRRILPVDSFEPNPFGLYQTSGNAAEWTEDCWNNSYRGAPTDGSAWTSGDCGNRAVRGGYWASVSWDLRSAARYNHVSSFRYYTNGLRVARTLATP